MKRSSVGAPEWRVASNARARTRRWDDGLVVYRADSGDTFLFESAALVILDRLAIGSATTDELYALVDDHAPEEDPDDLLARLRQAGLVARQAPVC